MAHRILVDDRWVTSMAALLNAVDDKYIQLYSISIVPEGLKQSNENDDAHIPRAVSMGPRFKGTKEDLLFMEQVKLRCMLSLIFRPGHKGEGRMHLRRCYQEILKIEEEIRASYVVDISHINVEDLVKILLVDGCFLLELLISKNGTLNDRIPSRARPLNPAAQVLENEEVLSDLILFENQIPICVLHAISRALFPNEFEENPDQRVTRINNLVLALLGYNELPDPRLRAPHILDVVHSYVNRVDGVVHQEDGTYVLNIPARGTNPKLERCASRLQAAGVTISTVAEAPPAAALAPPAAVPPAGVPAAVAPRIRSLDFEFKFQEGNLVIAQLNIRKTTKATWWNMIAWEHHKSKWMGYPRSKFTSAALIFDGLICSAADVKLLKEKNVIVDHTEMSSEELKEFFHTMTFAIDHGVADGDYVTLVNALNGYSTTWFITWMPMLFWHHLRRCGRWLIKWMLKKYRFLLSFVTFLTLVQTVYAMVAYHHPASLPRAR